MRSADVRTWIEISRSALEHNVRVLGRLCGESQLGAVVKSNAYGHGLEAVTSLLEDIPAVTWLFTAGIDEALQIRAQGSTKHILALAYADRPYGEAIINTIDCAVYDQGMLHELNCAAQRLGIKARAHIKVDTGMTRLGILPEEVVPFLLNAASQYPAVDIVGLFTHLADTNNPDQHFSYEQLDLFNHVRADVQRAGFVLPYTHALSSGGLLLPAVRPTVCDIPLNLTTQLIDVTHAPTRAHFVQASAPTIINPVDTYHVPPRPYTYSLARVGTNLYGQWKSDVQRYNIAKFDSSFELRPVLTWKTVIIQIKQVPVYSAVGYNCTFVTQRPSVIAILPVGYWDGYPRALSHKTSVLIGQVYAPVVGVVSMNLLAVDVTDVPGVYVGQEVVLIGGEGQVSATHLARLAGTINNELLTRLNPEIVRKIVD